MKGKLKVILLVISCLLLYGCGNAGVSQEEYDKVVVERDAYKEKQDAYEKENETLNKVKESLSVIDGLTFSESKGDECKTLIITFYLKYKTDTDNMVDKFSKLGEALDPVVKEEWFDYDYVIMDVWSNVTGALSSMTFEADNIISSLKTHQWYGDEEVSGTNNSDSKSETKALLYQDKKINIFYKGISEKGVVLSVENLTDVTITIQADAISINGESVNSITMSDDVAPQSTGDVVARFDVSPSTKAETIGGQLRIIDFEDSFKTYNAKFINIPIE